jgi:KH domain-containing protein
MQILEYKTIRKIQASRNLLEKKLKVSIDISGKKIEAFGESYDVFIAEKVFEAIDKAFPIEIALILLEENYVLEEIPIKDFTRKKSLAGVKARIVGAQGRTIELIGELSECYLTLSENTVCIIGPADRIIFAENAVKSLIAGAKQSKIYAYLEKSRRRVFPEDLGLKWEKE